ncbi:MAG: IPT/TIG domain-containing protein [Planctomycetota bacterium]
MMHHFPIYSGVLALAASLSAQSFNYTDFSSVGTLSLLGNAAQSGTALRLTANASNQTGWAWHQTKLPVVAGFDTTFSFRITPPTVGTKAEGMALVIHDDPNALATMGGTVWGMGYGNGANGAVGIRNSIAIELDTYQDAFLSDTSANELTIHTRGALGNHENEQYSIARNTPTTILSNGVVHTLRVRYVPGQIEVFVDGSATPAISRAYSLLTGGLYANNAAAPAPTLASGMAYLGFCATTGANTLTELVEILSWSWTSTPLTNPCYAGSIGQDVLTVGGSAGDFFRVVNLATYQAFPIALQAPTAFGPGAPYILFLSFAPNPGAPGTALGFGTTCFPVLPWGPLELVLADTFGLVNPLLPAAPAPHSIGIPGGLITFPLDFTLQAVIASSLSPFALGVSNAVNVKIRPSAPPTITTVAPASALPGQSITITGTNFVPGTTLAVNGSPVTPTSASTTQIAFPYPASVPCGSSLAITLPDSQSVTAPLNPVPTVTSTVLGSGTAAGGALFLVIGSGFAPGSTVTIGGVAATVTSATSTLVQMNTPPGTPGVAQVVITTPGGCTTTTSYTYL